MKYLINYFFPPPAIIDVGKIDLYTVSLELTKKLAKQNKVNISHYVNRAGSASGVDLNIYFLFDHRWLFYCMLSRFAIIDIGPYLSVISNGYDRMPVINRRKFYNMFMLPSDSPLYNSLTQLLKDSYTSNLFNLYDAVYYSIYNKISITSKETPIGYRDGQYYQELFNKLIKERVRVRPDITV